MIQELDKNMVEFLEKWAPLRIYRKPVSDNFGDMSHPSIHMTCHQCKSEQTFVNIGSDKRVGGHSENYEYISDPFDVFLARYICAGCQKYGRLFILEVRKVDGKKVIRKIGQKPEWEVELEPRIAKVLGSHVTLFRRGVDCEQSGYGIGAFAYYRRLVESTIDELLNLVSPLLEGDRKDKYLEALKQTQKATVAQEKIVLVKELLPTNLCRGGINPLGILHDALSGGLHAESDEDCLEIAGAVREAIVFLVDELKRAGDSHKKFTESMQKFLEKRSHGRKRDSIDNSA